MAVCADRRVTILILMRRRIKNFAWRPWTFAHDLFGILDSSSMPEGLATDRDKNNGLTKLDLIRHAGKGLKGRSGVTK